MEVVQHSQPPEASPAAAIAPEEDILLELVLHQFLRPGFISKHMVSLEDSPPGENWLPLHTLAQLVSYRGQDSQLWMARSPPSSRGVGGRQRSESTQGGMEYAKLIPVLTSIITTSPLFELHPSGDFMRPRQASVTSHSGSKGPPIPMGLHARYLIDRFVAIGKHDRVGRPIIDLVRLWRSDLVSRFKLPPMANNAFTFKVVAAAGVGVLKNPKRRNRIIARLPHGFVFTSAGVIHTRSSRFLRVLLRADELEDKGGHLVTTNPQDPSQSHWKGWVQWDERVTAPGSAVAVEPVYTDDLEDRTDESLAALAQELHVNTEAETREGYITALRAPAVRTSDVIHYAVIKADTFHWRCAFLDLLYGETISVASSSSREDTSKGGNPEKTKKTTACVVPVVGPATHFVSHAWSNRWTDLIASLKLFHDNLLSVTQSETRRPVDGGQVYFWIDAFSVNQWGTSDITPPRPSCTSLDRGGGGVMPMTMPPLAAPPVVSNDNGLSFQTSFNEVIRAIKRTVVVAHPLGEGPHLPLVMRRTWCLWEIFSSVLCGATLTLTTTQWDHQALLAALSEDFPAVLQSLEAIDAEKAEATSTVDRDRINACIHREGGFDLVNEVVRGQILGMVLGYVVAQALNKGTSSVTTPESMAASFQNMQSLVRAGASTEQVVHTDRGYLTPILIAVWEDSVDVASFLLERGQADPNSCDKTGRRALDIATRLGSLHRAEMVGLLLRFGALTETAHSKIQRSALSNACGAADLETAALLLDHGADVNFRDAHGCTPLHILCSLSLSDPPPQAVLNLAQLLVSAGADASSVCSFGTTPLGRSLTERQRAALINGHRTTDDRAGVEDGDAGPSLASFLEASCGASIGLMEASRWGLVQEAAEALRRGSDPWVKDATNRDAIFYARERGHDTVTELLQRAMEE